MTRQKLAVTALEAHGGLPGEPFLFVFENDQSTYTVPAGKTLTRKSGNPDKNPFAITGYLVDTP